MAALFTVRLCAHPAQPLPTMASAVPELLQAPSFSDTSDLITGIASLDSDAAAQTDTILQCSDGPVPCHSLLLALFSAQLRARFAVSSAPYEIDFRAWSGCVLGGVGLCLILRAAVLQA